MLIISRLLDDPWFCYFFPARKTFLPLNFPTIGENNPASFLLPYETVSVSVLISTFLALLKVILLLAGYSSSDPELLVLWDRAVDYLSVIYN